MVPPSGRMYSYSKDKLSKKHFAAVDLLSLHFLKDALFKHPRQFYIILEYLDLIKKNSYEQKVTKNVFHISTYINYV